MQAQCNACKATSAVDLKLTVPQPSTTVVSAALKAVGFTEWISIRNVSDLPCAPSSDDQYDRFQLCSSISGAYAVWAFLMGH